jgi:hypothetical protein
MPKPGKNSTASKSVSIGTSLHSEFRVKTRKSSQLGALAQLFRCPSCVFAANSHVLEHRATGREKKKRRAPDSSDKACREQCIGSWPVVLPVARRGSARKRLALLASLRAAEDAAAAAAALRREADTSARISRCPWGSSKVACVVNSRLDCIERYRRQCALHSLLWSALGTVLQLSAPIPS